MDRNFVKSLALAALAAMSLPTAALAEETGSLLVFPKFDNTRGTRTLLTVTNTNTDDAATIKVEFVYINGDNCQEFNRTRTLTPADTLSVLTRFDNPNQVEGYVYVFAKHKTSGAAIKFDWLAGSALILETNLNDPDTLYCPYTFKAGAALLENAITDVDGDGLRDLNGAEYQQAPDELIVPMFLADDGNWESRLVLINLTGGSQFTAFVNFLVYNDNEEVFSAQYSFDCWSDVALSDVSLVFDNGFLSGTNDNPFEIQNGGSLPETGWFWMDGLLANSSAATVADPAILAMLFIHDEGEGGACVPYTRGEQSNGDLLGHSIFADNN